MRKIADPDRRSGHVSRANSKAGIKMFSAIPEKCCEFKDELKDHKLNVAIERQEMDDAAARSILSPWEVLTIQVDAATQRRPKQNHQRWR